VTLAPNDYPSLPGVLMYEEKYQALKSHDRDQGNILAAATLNPVPDASTSACGKVSRKSLLPSDAFVVPTD
jgi:hypothetical protein